MTNYIEERIDELTDMATADDIKIHNHHFSESRKAASIDTGSSKAIMLDRYAISNDAEECCLLFEEVAHYMSGALYPVYIKNSRLARQNRRIAEAKAKNWIIKNYVPYSGLLDFLNKEQDPTIEDIANYFHVPREIIKMAIGIYRDRGLL